MKLCPFACFLTRGAYGARPWHHFAAYRAHPGWYALEVGSWRLEVFNERRKTPRWVLAVLAAAVLPAPFSYGSNGYAEAAVERVTAVFARGPINR